VETAKDMLMGKFIAVSAYIKKTETTQIKNVMKHIKLLEKQEKSKPKTSKWREITKIRAKINDVETNKLYKESMTQNVGPLKRIRSTNR
jgi:hypothetical protein